MPKSTVKEIVFVAMPFGTKNTDVVDGKGPSSINFDALWDQAFYPALNELGYLPVRADFQSGSVIIKDMLEQLVLADIVIVDISIPNGNVYYEAGIRHAIRESGCLLVSSNWARPLFDLAQIRQSRYTLNSEIPTARDYKLIKTQLMQALKDNSKMQSPVYSLIQKDLLQKKESHLLTENIKTFSDFQTRIRNCRLESSEKAEELSKQLLHDYKNQQIPNYIIKELFYLVRDKLGWKACLDFYVELDDKAYQDEALLEQVALAKSKLGDIFASIAALEQLNNNFGDTPERLGLIAGRYREMFYSKTNPTEKPRWLNRAIENYQAGMLLDLNEHYCASNLPALLLYRNRSTDKKEAEQIAKHVVNVCRRIQKLQKKDKWWRPSQLLMAFFLKDYLSAERLVDEIYNDDLSSWELTSTIIDLRHINELMPKHHQEKYESLIDQLTVRISVPQAILIKQLTPKIEAEGKIYQKFKHVYAYPAQEGELIVSRVSGVRETENTAQANDYVVKNQTKSQELYIVRELDFTERYDFIKKIDEQWSEYKPSGRIQIKAIDVDQQALALLKQNGTFHIYASWGSPQKVEEGDVLVTPLPDYKTIYRIARKEFTETYRLAEQ